MSNHYHLLLQTPEGNLVEGMRWLQSTYTARFNAKHRQRGHLFQGRYKAIPIQSDEPLYLRTLSDYIHLNPARAGIVNVSRPELNPLLCPTCHEPMRIIALIDEDEGIERILRHLWDSGKSQ
jgi:hypothetical protein